MKRVGRWFCVTWLLLLVCASWALDLPVNSLIYPMDEEPRSLRPSHMGDYYEGFTSGLIFDGLTQFTRGDKVEIEPGLAERWDISDDYRVFTFHLRKGAKFHNGEEVDAEDVRYSYEYVLHPDTVSPRTWMLDMIKGAKEFLAGKTKEVEGIKILDKYTVEITLEKPFVPFPMLLAMPNTSIVPKGIFEKMTPQDFTRKPVGSGPWKMKEWVHQQYFLLERNDEYWGKKANAEYFLYKVITNVLAEPFEFKAGKLDFFAIPTAETQKWLNDAEWKPYIMIMEELNTYFYAFGCQKPHLKDRRVRQAISHAVNVDKALQYIYQNRGVRAAGPIPPGLEGYDPEAKPWPYDPERAKQLLKEAGVKNLKIEIWQTDDELITAISEAFKADLRKVGIKATILKMDFSTLKAGIRRQGPDIYQLSWWADYPDIENFLFPIYHSSNWGGGGNGAHYKNPEVDRLIDEGRFCPDPKKRMELLTKAVEIIREDCPWIYLWHRRYFEVHQPWIKNYGLSKIFNGTKFNKVEIDLELKKKRLGIKDEKKTAKKE